jgi:small-conductance mechanosensitive channel
MLFIITILIFALLFLVLVFVDRSRPNKNYHIKAVDNDGPGGCLCWLNIIPLLLMMDSFTKWFNGVAPFLSQPYYEGNLYMTVIIWVIWWCSNMIIISLPIMLLKWRLKHFKSPEEKRAEQIELELSAIRVEVEKEDKQLEKCNKKNTNVNHDDLPF